MKKKGFLYFVRIIFYLSLLIFLGSHFSVRADTPVPPDPLLEKIDKEFPATLPELTQKSELDINTPEYVVIHPSDKATFSSETTASIASIPLKEGSKFRAGDVLLLFDCRLQDAELKKAQAKLQEGNAAYSAAKKLKYYGSISEFEVIKAKSDFEVAHAEVDRLKALVDKCTIKAPFNGAIAELKVHAHETVRPGDPLLTIVNTDNLEFEIRVPSCWLQWLHLGDEFSVHINETNEKISAKITKINPEIEPVSQSVKLIGTIIPNNPKLLPGMTGQAKFPDHPASKCAEVKL